MIGYYELVLMQMIASQQTLVSEYAVTPAPVRKRSGACAGVTFLPIECQLSTEVYVRAASSM